MTPVELKKLREKVDTAERLTARIEAASQLITLLNNKPSKLLLTEDQLDITDEQGHVHSMGVQKEAYQHLLSSLLEMVTTTRRECWQMLDHLEP